MKEILSLHLAVIILAAGAGCQGVTSCGDITALTEDVDGDGFLEVAPPDGFEFDFDSTISVFAQNTLVPTDLLPHVEEVGLDPATAEALINQAEFFVKFSFELDYGDGTVQTICDMVPFDEFEIAFETLCPLDADLTVEAIATLPLFGGIPIATVPIGLTVDAVDFVCGQTISLVTTKDESGEVV